MNTHHTHHTRQPVALVTGGSSGMGKIIAEKLLASGHHVIAAARRTGAMTGLEQLGATVIRLDLTEEASIGAAASQIEARFGAVDVLVNNAGFGLYGAVEDVSLEDARRQFEVNLFGLARLTQLLLPAMRARGTGRIINITSMGGKVYTPLGAWYHATKHALEGWSDCLRLELAAKGIQVVVVEPGTIRTEFGSVMSGGLRKHLPRTSYAELTRTVADATDKFTRDGAGSPPEVIARVVLKAVKARRPRTRYAAGQYAKMTLFIRKWFGDRVFDRMVMSMVK
ncbi:oxidoreductase [Luteolibacter sp. LG18]|uniref:oxidoreductase n=1 Tax=Luteolibacter sp. LG18 TaxID=2819286 RepID=UPI002B2F082A|nr:short-chain dehydrogenase/reductase [Luteolibacter sp. LG18]